MSAHSRKLLDTIPDTRDLQENTAAVLAIVVL